MFVKLLSVSLCIIIIHVASGADVNAQNAISNSFEEVLKRTNPLLHYSYIDSIQTHNYSGNWDFDSDGKSDSVYFIGNGGAHLYFHLKIQLSSGTVADELSFVSLDMPIVASEDDLKSSRYNPLEMLAQFAVYDFDKDGRPDIFIHLDSHSEIPRKLRRQGIRKYFLICFEGRSIRFKNFEPRN